MRGILWTDTASEPPLGSAPLDVDGTTSVAIIGAGYAGLSAALHLAEAGVDCLVLEAGTVGAGASGRNNGQVIPGLKLGPDDLERRYGDAGAAVAETAAGAADLVFDLVERHAIDCEPDRRGWVRAAHAARAMPSVEKTVRQWQGRGAAVEALDATGVERALGTGAYVGGLIDRRAGRLNPLSYCRGLARAAAAAGARIHESSPVLAFERKGGRWELRTATGTVAAETVVLATGAYDERLLPGWSQGFMTVHAMQIASAPVSANLRATVLPGVSAMSDTRKLATALRLDADGRVVISGRGPLSGRCDESVQQQLIRTALRLYPALEGQGWTHLWPGRIAVTMDELPRLSAPAPGLFAIVGFNGRGVAMATALGKAAAQHALGRPAGFPVVPAPKVPFHAARQPLLAAAISYYRFRDALGFASR